MTRKQLMLKLFAAGALCVALGIFGIAAVVWIIKAVWQS